MHRSANHLSMCAGGVGRRRAALEEPATQDERRGAFRLDHLEPAQADGDAAPMLHRALQGGRECWRECVCVCEGRVRCEGGRKGKGYIKFSLPTLSLSFSSLLPSIPHAPSSTSSIYYSYVSSALSLLPSFCPSTLRLSFLNLCSLLQHLLPDSINITAFLSLLPLSPSHLRSRTSHPLSHGACGKGGEVVRDQN